MSPQFRDIDLRGVRVLCNVRRSPGSLIIVLAKLYAIPFSSINFLPVHRVALTSGAVKEGGLFGVTDGVEDVNDSSSCLDKTRVSWTLIGTHLLPVNTRQYVDAHSFDVVDTKETKWLLVQLLP